MTDMDDDFNTSKALAHLFGLVAGIRNTNADDPEIFRRGYYYMWQKLAGEILGILPTHASDSSDTSNVLENVVQLNIRQRKAARDRRDFATSDSIRKELEEAGIILEDTKDGTTWRLK
jgi:cysteinyl-tRNA synthetase